MAKTRYEGIHIGRIGIGSVAVLTVLISAWGALVPYIGPTFGFSADGSSSWHWSLTHSLVGLVPGAVGVVIGLLILAETRGIMVGRGRMSLASAGVVAALAGAWFIVGPLAIPVITGHGAYFVAAAPLRELANQVGYAMGPGFILAVCGAFAIGWASRHQERASVPVDAVTSDAPSEATVPGVEA
jgi:hypothetical protein